MYSCKMLRKGETMAVFLGICIQVFSTDKERQYLVLTRGMEMISKKNCAYVFHDINHEVAIEYAYQMAANLIEDGQILEAFEDYDKYILDPDVEYEPASERLIRLFSI